MREETLTMTKLQRPEGKFRNALKVANIPEGGFNATLTGTHEAGGRDDFYENYIGFVTSEDSEERFLGIGNESMSLTTLIDAYGDETSEWKGKPVHIGSAIMKSGKYAGTACLALSIPTKVSA